MAEDNKKINGMAAIPTKNLLRTSSGTYFQGFRSILRITSSFGILQPEGIRSYPLHLEAFSTHSTLPITDSVTIPPPMITSWLRVLLSYSKDDDSWLSEAKLYSLSTNSWRRIGYMPFLPIGPRHQCGVLTNSTVHWVAKRNTGIRGITGLDTAPSVIVSFELKDEKYREVPPPDFVDDRFYLIIGVLRGQLCMFCDLFPDCVELWVMKDYSVRDSWAKQFSIGQSLIGLFTISDPYAIQRMMKFYSRKHQERCSCFCMIPV
ncbi:uncharacterized protein LOC122089677 [Macadamia integrifolia]|uniref:uncharacterized protein LOC122089677 n=1 Tax=Macadamia integrifolia TaxID=60698 RepID=UPI001C4F7F0A|nr:uncharacterized protein LOC122089677 [Macadamia integrifolia]